MEAMLQRPHIREQTHPALDIATPSSTRLFSFGVSNLFPLLRALFTFWWLCPNNCKYFVSTSAHSRLLLNEIYLTKKDYYSHQLCVMTYTQRIKHGKSNPNFLVGCIYTTLLKYSPHSQIHNCMRLSNVPRLRVSQQLHCLVISCGQPSFRELHRLLADDYS